MENKIFDFSENEVRSIFQYDLKLVTRIGDSFDYVFETLQKLGYIVSGDNPKLSKDKFMEGKNYHWSSLITNDGIKMLFRQYGLHLTVFTCFTKERKLKTFTIENKTYSSFTFYVDTHKITKEDKIENIEQPNENVKYLSDYYSDYFYDEPFIVFNQYLNEIIEHVREEKEWLISNSSSIKVPNFVEIKMIFHKESIDSYDKVIFCAEELSSIHIVLFSQNEMLKAIKKFKVGDVFGKGFNEGIITKVNTKVKKDYYHDCGLGVKLKHKNENEWIDVYSLTQWHMKDVFSEENDKKE